MTTNENQIAMQKRLNIEKEASEVFMRIVELLQVPNAMETTEQEQGFSTANESSD